MKEPLRQRDYQTIKYYSQSLKTYLEQCFLYDNLTVTIEKQGRDVYLEVFEDGVLICREPIS